MERTCFDNLAGLMRQSASSKTLPKDTLNHTGDKSPTLFDICNDDRNRILKLIEELLDTQEDAEKLRQKLDEERVEFKEKRSVFIKKLDGLSERYEKALCENNILKDRYCNNLKQLEEKISTVSNQLEASVVEIRRLRQINAELVNENSALRRQNQEAANSLASYNDDKSRTGIEKNGQTRNEKWHRKQKKVTSKVQTLEEENMRLDRHDFACNTNPVHERKETTNRRSGAGDFIKEKNSTSTSFETIKAPAVVIFDKNINSAFNLTSDSKYATNRHIPPCSLQNNCLLNCTNTLEDNTLLENLFFRF